jgi:lactoylglutathione lyase
MGAVLGQYCINVTDLERSIELWDSVLGIPLVRRTEIPGVHEAVLQAPAGGSRLQLAQHDNQDGPIDMGTALWKLYVVTDDCQGLHDKAVAAGCDSVMAPTKLEQWPTVMAYVKDFDGYLIELVEYLENVPAGIPDPKTT